MIDDCKRCNGIFKLNKCHKEVYEILRVIWTADEWAHKGRAYRVEKEKKEWKFVKLPKAEHYLFRKPRWKYT